MVDFSHTAFKATLSAVLAVGLLVAGGCDSSVLDKQPQDQIAENAVWKDRGLTEAYLLDSYDQLNLQQGYGFNTFMSWRYDAFGGYMITGAAWQYLNHGAMSVPDGNGAHWSKNYWVYDNIRRANTIIEEVSKSDFDRGFISQVVAEARFIRAFSYFRMVKRYGGVPLITKAQPLDAPDDSIFVERASEQEVYDFIASEVDAMVDHLPEPGEVPAGRASKYAALALKSRAMLFAGSIAEFGEVKMNGLLGIPSSEADQYWQAAYDASKKILDSGEYSLFDEFDDPSVNYYKLFVTDLPENSEAIFGNLFDGADRGHSNALQNLPMELASKWGANAGATYSYTMDFNYQDGSEGYIPVSEIENQQWSAEELFGDRDPRFDGSAIYPGDEFRGTTITFHEATMVDGEEVTSGTVGNGWPASSPPRNRSTGLLVQKRLADDLLPTSHGTDDTDFIEFRLGEIYMNAAEAAFYIGKRSKSLEYVNEIRERVDMPQLDQVSQEAIRHERNVELNLEGQRWWDLRRWRVAEDVLDGLRVKGFSYTYDLNTEKYNVDVVNLEGQKRVFRERQYYLPLEPGWLASNPKLKQNPGYSE